jgi:hypothetical protein
MERSKENPVYTKFKQDNGAATDFYAIQVDEGWRSWILCADMYESKANQLIERLTRNNSAWKD